MSSQRVSVCQVDDLSEGQMRQFSVADSEILLVRSEAGFSAIAPHCSHYGAPLAKGVLHAGRIVCPWHNACYDAESGIQIEPPGCDNLAKYPVQVESGTVYIELPEDGKEHIMPDLAEPDTESDRRVFAIVGGGAAGNAAAQMLRQVDYKGRIVMLTADSELPYDRTKLSKAYLQSDEVKDPDLLRPADFYKKYGIEVKTAARVSKLDVESQQLTYGNGDTLSYDALLLATGGKVRQIPIEGADKSNVFTLRQAEDAQQILQAAKGAKKAVIIGDGFIGMEVAASLRQQGLDVTVVASHKIPFKNVLGESVGKLFRQVHESEGVRFKLETKAKAFHGENKVETVELDSGEKLEADLVVVGIGVQPATDFIEGLLMDKEDGSVLVNQYLQATPSIYAAGDIAQFPHFITGQPTRIEHWRLAMQHGQIAACNMAGQKVTFEAVPFFWTGQFDMKLRYVGHAEKWDDMIIQGNLEEKDFLAFYAKDDQVMAVSGIGRDRDIAAISELLRLRKMPPASEIQETDTDWAKQLAAIAA